MIAIQSRILITSGSLVVSLVCWREQGSCFLRTRWAFSQILDPFFLAPLPCLYSSYTTTQQQRKEASKLAGAGDSGFIVVHYSRAFPGFPSLFHTKHQKRLTTRPKTRNSTWPLPKVLAKIHVTAVLHIMYSRKEIALIKVNQNGLIAQKLHFAQNLFTMISTMISTWKHTRNSLFFRVVKCAINDQFMHHIPE
jgi:hypothetical protein